MDAPMVELAGVGRTYRSDSGLEVDALRAVDLSIRAGEFVVVVGPTGCGKTTLLNLVSGLDRPDAGAIRLSGGLVPGANMPCVMQHYTLFPWRTLLRNVAFGPQMRGVPRGERTLLAEALLAKVGLDGFEDSYPHELSGGMRQRAAIAQALATEPRLLLMDEPFGAVDDATRRELQGMIIDVRREMGLAVLMVTHSIDEAIVLADRVVVLSHRPGRVVAEVPVNLDRPRGEATRASPEFFAHVNRVRSALRAAPDDTSAGPDTNAAAD